MPGFDVRIAYFSMEIALQSDIPTYSGGLGVLAGDTLRAAADLGVRMVGVTLLHRRGYFRQLLDARGHQAEEPVEWDPSQALEEMPERVSLTLEGRKVSLRSWKYGIHGQGGAQVPVYLLDSDVPENEEQDRRLCDRLYGGDTRYRLLQEALLGIGGVRMLRALGHRTVERFHMNEGHAAFLTLELLEEEAGRNWREAVQPEDLDAVRERCIFTTHTPVPAGHDQFPLELVQACLGEARVRPVQDAAVKDSSFNMTYLALRLSCYVNGVARRHGEVSRLMFAPHRVDAITNGVHTPTWASPSFAKLFDSHTPGWRRDAAALRNAMGISLDEIWSAHLEAKNLLVERVRAATGVEMDPEAFILGFARRMTPYKRGALLFRDLDRLRSLAAKEGPLQVVYSGKAHPRDGDGKAIIVEIFEAARAMGPEVKVVYLPDYSMELGRLVTAGVDVWLNTPRPPLEASGTSGMKAALNGVPSLSMLDGWWVEGHVEGVTGWAMDDGHLDVDSEPDHSDRDAAALYDSLERVILPMYYRSRADFVSVMRHAIALNGSFFHTHRMVQEYILNAYSGVTR